MKLSLPAGHLPFATLHSPARSSWQVLRSAVERLKRLTPTLETHYQFAQRLLPPPPRQDVDGVYTRVVAAEDDPHYPEMLRIGREQGLDAAWCHEQLVEGARCVLAFMDGSPHRAVGMGMVRRRPFWVDEIRHHFDPGADGCYLYALYVSPPYRGRRIQRAINSNRLAAGDGVHWLYTLVARTNTASLKGHFAHGAHLSARLDCLRIGRLLIASVRRLRPSLPIGTFRHDGFPARGRLHLILDK